MNDISRPRVFLVEDERIVLADLSKRFTSNGYRVVGVAQTGAQAIDSIKELKPDLVVLDIKLSGELDGIEVAIVLESHFEFQLPIVFLTGYQETGFDYLKVLPNYKYVRKPFEEEQLLTAAREALQQVVRVGGNGNGHSENH